MCGLPLVPRFNGMKWTSPFVWPASTSPRWQSLISLENRHRSCWEFKLQGPLLTIYGAGDPGWPEQTLAWKPEPWAEWLMDAIRDWIPASQDIPGKFPSETPGAGSIPVFSSGHVLWYASLLPRTGQAGVPCEGKPRCIPSPCGAAAACKLSGVSASVLVTAVSHCLSLGAGAVLRPVHASSHLIQPWQWL